MTTTPNDIRYTDALDREDVAIEFLTSVLGYPSQADHPDDLGEPIAGEVQAAVQTLLRRSWRFRQFVHEQLGEA